MSVTDPLLKLLKSHIFTLTSSQPIDDSRFDLQRFCEILELILRKGLRFNVSLLDISPRDYIHCFIDLHKHSNLSQIRCSHVFGIIIENAKSSTKVITNQGRGRYFLRSALQHKILHQIVQLLIQSQNILVTWYNKDYSILRHEILSEIFLSCLMQLSELEFNLCLENHLFLDDSWIMPIFKSISFVPSLKMGLELHHCAGRIIVIGMEDGGLIGDITEIEEGDILDSLYGHALRNCLKGDITTLLRRYKNKPCTLTFVKCKLRSNTIFPPIEELIKLAIKQGCKLHSIMGENPDVKKPENDIVIPPHALLNDYEQLPVHNAIDKAVYECIYLGKIQLGKDGSVDQVEYIVKSILKDQKEGLKVSILIGEKDVTVTELETKKVLLISSFTKISACGRTDDFSCHFCFIEGETSCTISNDFKGHVFRAASYDIAKIIMLSIAQGFERTHWFV